MLNWLGRHVISGFGDAKGREEKEDGVCAVLGIFVLKKKISNVVRRVGQKGREEKSSCADSGTLRLCHLENRP